MCPKLSISRGIFHPASLYDTLDVDIVKVDLLLVQKISKRHFSRDIEKSFQEVTPIGLEPHNFFLLKISQQIWLLETSKVLDKMGHG